MSHSTVFDVFVGRTHQNNIWNILIHNHKLWQVTKTIKCHDTTTGFSDWRQEYKTMNAEKKSENLQFHNMLTLSWFLSDLGYKNFFHTASKYYRAGLFMLLHCILMRVHSSSCLHSFTGVDMSDRWSYWQELLPGAAVQDHYTEWSLKKYLSWLLDCCRTLNTANACGKSAPRKHDGNWWRPLINTLQALLDESDRLWIKKHLCQRKNSSWWRRKMMKQEHLERCVNWVIELAPWRYETPWLLPWIIFLTVAHLTCVLEEPPLSQLSFSCCVYLWHLK